MSVLTRSKHPAYHLRPNKAIDRSIFLEMLRVFDSQIPLNAHTYVGLGGPFLEDFRLMAQTFPKMKMFSIEEDEDIYKRQKFHQCTKNVKLINSSFEDFLSSKFPTGNPTITWADYTSFEKKALLEVATIARAATPLSILRITVKAETPLYRELSLGSRRPADMPPAKAEAFKQMIEKFRGDFDVQDVRYDESLFTWNNFKEEKYPNLLSNLLFSVITASCSAPKVYLPIHSVKYSDGTIMLSVTGVICLEQDRQRIADHFKDRCEFYSDNHNNVEMIDVPMLTTKERLHLEQEVPAVDVNGETVISRLGYLIEVDAKTSKHKIKQYEKYHRQYPYFGKLVP